jgi:hypothetical protein
MTVTPDAPEARPLARFLFEEVTEDESPLFKSGGQLADLLKAHVAAFHGRNAKSLATFIYAIVRGDRPLPENLRTGIEDLIRQRFAEADAQEAWIARFRQVIADLDTEAPDPSLADAGELWDAVVTLSMHAQTQFIITATPAETERLWQAEKLTRILEDRLDLASDATDLPTSTTYTFCFPDEETAGRFWKKIVAGIVKSGRATLKQVEARLTALNAGGALRVFCVPAIACGAPVVVFNPASAVSDGYTLFYHGEKKHEVSVARMDPEYLEFWTTNVYARLIDRMERPSANDAALSVKEITFSA